MKKLELIRLLVGSGIHSGNIMNKTSLNRFKKSERDEILSFNLDRVKSWLEDYELSERMRKEREIDKIEANRFNMSLKSYRELVGKGKQILGSFHTGHSMGCYRTLSINNKFFVDSVTLDRYSKGCRYKEVYGDIRINLTKKELKLIENIEGVWTIKLGDGRCKWLESNGSYSKYAIDWVYGYIYGTTHSSESLQEARVSDNIKKFGSGDIKIKLSTFIGWQHIRMLGACYAGIKSFCDRHNLDIENGYNIEYLVDITKNDSIGKNYIKRLYEKVV